MALLRSRDAQGNAMGGVRSTYLDVRLARHEVVSTQHADARGGFQRCDMIVHVLPLERSVLARLYGDAAGYRQRVAARVAALVRERWYLRADAEEIKTEARAASWP